MQKLIVGFNDLETIYPHLAKEWDYNKNDKSPNEYTPKSNAAVYWICSKCGYNFKAKICNRTNRNGGCNCCNGRVVLKGINDLATTHPNLALEWHPTKNGILMPTDVTFGMAKKVWWLCPEGHDYQATINHRSSGTNCPICNAGRQTSFAEQAVYYYVKQIFPDAISRYTEIFQNSMELDIYIPSIKLAIEYDGMAWHKSDKLNRERRKYEICKENGIKLFRLIEHPTEKFISTADESISIDGNMYEHKNLEKVIRILLDNIGFETNKWTRKNFSHFHSNIDINIKRDEKEIRTYMTKLNSESFSDIYPALVKEWHPYKNGTLSPQKVKPHSDIIVWWLCPTCGHEYEASIGHRSYGTGCPKCGITKSAEKRSKCVSMYDINSGSTLKTFSSLSEASRETGISSGNISAVCKGLRNHAGGYGWKYNGN